MGDSDRQIIEKLQTGDLSRDLNAIYLASELLRGFVNESPTEQELEKSIVVALERYRDQDEPKMISAPLWTLSKTGKSEYKSTYREYLRIGLDKLLTYNQIAYHMLLALSDCEDDIAVLDWQEDEDGVSHVSLGSSDHDRIARLARKYLEVIDRSAS